MSTAITADLAKIIELKKKLIQHSNALRETSIGLSPEDKERCDQALAIVEELDKRLGVMSALTLNALPAHGTSSS
jgi:hypothetical protein